VNALGWRDGDVLGDAEDLEPWGWKIWDCALLNITSVKKSRKDNPVAMT
jgi:hypothetical protein